MKDQDRYEIVGSKISMDSEKLSLCLEVASLHEEYTWADCNMDVHFGCDCSCKGDSYTYGEWDKMAKDLEKVKSKMEELLEKIEIKK